jgi:hypothetical protein
VWVKWKWFQEAIRAQSLEVFGWMLAPEDLGIALRYMQHLR